MKKNNELGGDIVVVDPVPKTTNSKNSGDGIFEFSERTHAEHVLFRGIVIIVFLMLGFFCLTSIVLIIPILFLPLILLSVGMYGMFFLFIKNRVTVFDDNERRITIRIDNLVLPCFTEHGEEVDYDDVVDFIIENRRGHETEHGRILMKLKNGSSILVSDDGDMRRTRNYCHTLKDFLLKRVE